MQIDAFGLWGLDKNANLNYNNILNHIKLKIDLHEAYDFEQKENKSYDKDKFPYKNEKEF